MSGNGSCPNCGWDLIGDGFTSVLQCENTTEDTWDISPDDSPVYCGVIPPTRDDDRKEHHPKKIQFRDY